MTRLPDVPFFLFGMGGREKMLYKQGALLDPTTGRVIRQWDVRSDRIEPAAYAVRLETTAGHRVSIFEDEEACWLETEGEREALSRGHVNLPSFAGRRYADVLRVLHQEMLVNIRVPALRAGAPLPNLIVYDKPWYRDGAMVCMCLEKTGNLHLVRDWILGLREPFDRNNASTCEPDNLGQALYLISLVADGSRPHRAGGHPLVKVILDEVEKFRTGDYIVGSTDSGEHPVYQTKWLKFGLWALDLPDPFQIPPVFDPYSALFWMDFKEQHVPGPRFKQMSRERYPYLGWAEDHFYGDPPGPIGGGLVYPLTWEAYAGEAKYERMAVVSEGYVDLRLAAPHTWHAAEMFLRLLECE